MQKSAGGIFHGTELKLAIFSHFPLYVGSRTSAKGWCYHLGFVQIKLRLEGELQKLAVQIYIHLQIGLAEKPEPKYYSFICRIKSETTHLNMHMTGCVRKIEI